jgi:hypothetical protein
MSYDKPITNYRVKDELRVGDPAKRVLGGELSNEFEAIAKAITNIENMVLLPNIDSDINWCGALDATSSFEYPGGLRSVQGGDIYLTTTAGKAAPEWIGLDGAELNVGNAIGFSAVEGRWYLIGDIAGVEGQEGPQGEQGEKGEKGDDGEPGADGKDGADGTDGVDGKDGVDGEDGLPGADGADGKDGVDGKDGADGEKGDKGDKGEDGKDADSVEGFLKGVDEYEAPRDVPTNMVSWTTDDSYNTKSGVFNIRYEKKSFAPDYFVTFYGHFAQSNLTMGVHCEDDYGYSTQLAGPYGLAVTIASSQAQFLTPEIALGGDYGYCEDENAAVKLKRDGPSTFKHAVQAADFLDADGNSIVGAGGGGGGEGFLKSVDEIEFDYNTEGPIGDVVSWSFNDTYNNVSSDFKITWGKRYYGPLRNVAEGHWIQSSPNGVGLHASKSDGSKESFYWANPAGYAQIYASTTTQIFSPSIALAAPNGGTADGEAAIKLKNNGTSTFKHAIKAADFLDRQGNSIIGAGGGLWTDDGKLGISYGEADGNQGNVNIYGEDRYKPQLCLQGPVGSTPSIWFRGASLGMMDNPLYCQVKASAAGHGNGQELQVWTVTDDEGGYGHQPFVFGSNGTFFIQPDRSTDAVNYDVTAGFRNDDGKLQFRHESGRWNDLTDLGGSTRSVSPTQLIETLSTLRDATRDETTVEGLRDSIGNAIGGIIEKLESQIKTVREMSK